MEAKASTLSLVAPLDLWTAGLCQAGGCVVFGLRGMSCHTPSLQWVHLLAKGNDMDENADQARCLNHGDDCRGPVEYHLRPADWKSFARCEFHQEQRERDRENSMERYADCDVAPGWFDPSYAGERWDDEY